MEKRGFRKRLLIVILSFLAVSIISPFVAIFWWIEPAVLAKIEDLKKKQSDPVYFFDYKNIDMKLWQGDLCIEEFSIIPRDSASIIFDTYDLALIMELQTDVCISGFGIFEYLVNNKFVMQAIDFQNTELSFFVSEPETEPDTLEFGEGEELSDLPAVLLQELAIDHTSVTIFEEDGNQLFSLDSLTIRVNDIEIDHELKSSLFPGLVFGSATVTSGPLALDLTDEYGIDWKDLEIINTYDDENDNYDVSFAINDFKIRETNPKDFGSYQLSGDLLSFNKWNYEAFLRDNSFIFSSLLLEGMYLKFVSTQTEGRPQTDKPMEQALLEQFNVLHFDSARIKNASFDIHMPEKNQSYYFKNYDIEVMDVTANDSTIDLPFGFVYREINMSGGSFLTELNEYYQLKFDAVELGAKQSAITILGFGLVPTMDKVRFASSYPYETDRMMVSAQKLEIGEIDLAISKRLNGLVANKLKIDGLTLEAYRDKFQQDPPYKEVTLPASKLKDLKFPLFIKQASITNAEIAYEQLGDMVESDSLGRLEFNNSTIQVFNITNIESFIKEDSVMKMTFETQLMDHGLGKGKMAFHLNSNEDYFEVHAILDTFPAMYLNPFVNNLLFVKINSGQLHSTRFDMTANNDEMNGFLEMEYEDLLFQVIRQDDLKVRSGFWNFVTNSSIKRNNNPEKNNYKKGTIYFPRKKDKFLFNYIWNGLKTGMLDIMVPFNDQEKKRKKQKKKLSKGIKGKINFLKKKNEEKLE